MKYVTYLCILPLIFVLVQCATLQPSSINMPLKFQDRPGKISLSLGLYVSPETRAYVLKDKYDRVLNLGAALEESALQSLQKVFRSVKPVQSGDKSVQRILELQVDKETVLESEFLMTRPKTIKLSLRYIVRSNKGDVVMDKTAKGEAISENPDALKAAFSRSIALEGEARSISKGGTEALQKCLEALNDQIMKDKSLF